MDNSNPQYPFNLEPHSTSKMSSPSQKEGWRSLPPDDSPGFSLVIVRNAVRELVETAVYILLVFVIVRSMVQNFKIEGSSMEPSLHTGQYILVNKLIYFHFDAAAPLHLMPGYNAQNLMPQITYPLLSPKRGDIVVFEYPNDPKKDYIKRVIGLPGEKLRINGGYVSINGKKIEEPYLKPNEQTYCNSEKCNEGKEVVVPPNNLFVMGDNRGNSSDSREWGLLPFDNIIGQAWLLYFPLDKIGPVLSPTYAIDQ